MQQDNIKIVMVETSHPGNVGAAARAMHNTCFGSLRLVDPQCPIGDIAYARASGANSVLDQRQTYDDLPAAIADCELVVALSARHRSLTWAELDTDQLRDKLDIASEAGPVALIFGREHSGLTNDEVQLCHYMHAIPTNPAFSSLNVAAAVQIICYELYRRQHTAAETAAYDDGDRPATSGEFEGYMDHLLETIEDSGFYDPDRPGQIVARLRRLFLRCEPSRGEVNILRGILASLERRRR